MRGRYFVSHADSYNVVALARAIHTPNRKIRKNKDGDWIAYEGRERKGNFKQNYEAATKWANRER